MVGCVRFSGIILVLGSRAVGRCCSYNSGFIDRYQIPGVKASLSNGCLVPRSGYGDPLPLLSPVHLTLSIFLISSRLFPSLYSPRLRIALPWINCALTFVRAAEAWGLSALMTRQSFIVWMRRVLPIKLAMADVCPS